MHDLEPFYNWRHLYAAEEDERSPFFGEEHSEFEFIHSIYGYCIHPQWDDMGSPTLFLKILFAEYEEGFAVIELLGEWNDCINNDIMFMKRGIIDSLFEQGISKFIFIGENVFNFHFSDESYYEEWAEDSNERGGWTALLNFRAHVQADFTGNGIHRYFFLNDPLNHVAWRTFTPLQLFQTVEKIRNSAKVHSA